jgi:hypothetical protein
MTHTIVHVPAGGLDPDNQPAIIAIENTSLDTMQKLVGGYIEAVTLAPGVIMYVNEEGLLRSLPPNRLIRRIDGAEIPVVGDAIIIGTTDDGETVGLSAEQGEAWLRFAQEAPVALLGLS